jgi:SAM-dependent methyltransferase
MSGNEPKIPVSTVEKIRHRLSRLLRGDDYDWGAYHNHYSKEFDGASSNYAVEIGDFEIVDGGVVRPSESKTLHPNVELFLKVLVELSPASVLEIGPGWGHQLVMAKRVIGAEVFGVDISQKQLDRALEEFPELAGNLDIGDVTQPLSRTADLVYSNAVTMHLGATRMDRALKIC